MSRGAVAALRLGLTALLSSAAVRAQAPAQVDPWIRVEQAPAAADPAAAAGESLADAASRDVAASPSEAGVAEAVVTVDRRRKNLQDYSGTAAAFSESQLTSLGLTNVRQLSVMVPGMQIGTTESGTAIYIRGVGSDNNTELGDPAVAVYVDGVYLPRPRGLGSMFFDIARVEVNSGPQGTLRGRNATGGSINLISREPQLDEVQANAQATFGSYALRSYQGMLNLPVVRQQLGLRVAAITEAHDPYWENAGPIYDLRGLQSADNFAYRVAAKYQPSKIFDVYVAYDFLREGGTGYTGANFNGALTRVADNGGTPNVTADDTYIPFDIRSVESPRRVYQRGTQARTTLEHQGLRANATVNAGPVLFEALASYRDLDYRQWTGSNAGAVVPGIDISGHNPDAWGGANQWHMTSRSTVAELRAYAPDSERLRWTIGAFYFYEDQGAFVGQLNDPVGASGGGEFNMPHTRGRSIAGFADATFDVSMDFRVLGGVRLTREHKDRKNGLWALWNNLPPNGSIPGIAQPAPPSPPNASLGRFGTEGFRYKGHARQNYLLPANASVEDRVNLFLDGIQSFGARDEVPVALCNDPPAASPGQTQQPRIELNAEGNFRCTRGVRAELPDNIFSFVPQNNEVDNTFVDYRVGAELDLAKDNLLYATLSTGHKAAGFNDTQSFASVPVFNSKYDPESLYAIELGSKNLFWERASRLNASLFYYGYTDMQFQSNVAVERDLDPSDNLAPQGSSVRQNTKNRTDIVGLDVAAGWSLPAGLEAEVHLLLMDARFPDGTIVNDNRLNFGSAPAGVDLGGNWLPRASAVTINYSLSQLLFTEAGAFSWQVQAQTRGTHYFTVFNGNGKRLVRPAAACAPPFDNPNCFSFENYDANLVPTPNPSYTQAQNSLQKYTDVQPTYTVFNVGAGWTHPSGRLAISGYVNNLFDIDYANAIVSAGAANIRYYNNQRLAGVRVRVDW